MENSPAVRARRFKVVAVDDERDLLNLIRLWLGPQCDVVCLASGEDLVNQLLRIGPDLVIMDLHMPGENGFDLCDRLRRHARFASLPVILLTGQIGGADPRRSAEVRATACWRKPIRCQDFQSKVSEVLASLPS